MIFHQKLAASQEKWNFMNDEPKEATAKILEINESSSVISLRKSQML
jgi:hypothetical protein